MHEYIVENSKSSQVDTQSKDNATPVRDDGSKTIYCVSEENVLRIVHLGTLHHVTSYPWSRSIRMEKQPKAILSKPPHTCALCDGLDHLVN